MEDLLAQEQAAEQLVYYLLKRPDEPIVSLLKAFGDYRNIIEKCIFTDFEHGAAPREAKLWQAHTEGKKYFHKALSPLRKQADQQPVAIRQLIKLYLQFLKEGQSFYRQHIQYLNRIFGGIRELELVAHHVKKDDSGESSQSSLSPDLQKVVLASCHRALICLGDLSRYRASEKLDRDPDFGPAVGYYGLACTIVPSSGMGQHQQAVIALEQQHHLRAIYHLYRAIVVEEPHPNAAQNLKREFDRTNAAWDRGELIKKTRPKDPESAKNTLIGWFVRLHSMCFKGEPVRGYDELEREVLGQLAAEIKQRPLDATLLRMVMTNFAAQYNAAEQFQENPIQQNQNAFLRFFRLNIKTFTTLLRVFYDDLRAIDLNNMNIDEDDDNAAHLMSRLTKTARRILPMLRLYSAWLLPMVNLLDGLSSDELKDVIEQFWSIYAKAVDLVANVFPIWDFDDLPEITYMLEEDAETRGFKPLMDEPTNGIWYDKNTGEEKMRFSSLGVHRASVDGEMLARVKGFLVDGLYLANDNDQAPIKLRQSRILHNDAQDVETPMPVFPKKAAPAPATNNGVTSKSPAPTKPISYAAAASSNRPVKATARNAQSSGDHPGPKVSRHAQLSRMVDDLVGDDDDGNTPTTPPQQHTSNPAVVNGGDVSYSAMHGNGGLGQMPTYAYTAKQKPIGAGPGMDITPPNIRTPRDATMSRPTDPMQSVASLWNDNPAPHSSPFPSGLPTGTLGSPAHFNSRGHSRVNSASSIRSRTSQTTQAANSGLADSWFSSDSTPRPEDKLSAWKRASQNMPQQYRASAAAAETNWRRNAGPNVPPVRDETTIKETFKKTSANQRLGAPRRYQEPEYTVHDREGSRSVASLTPQLSPAAPLPNGLAPGFAMESSTVTSPLLFGAGDSVWSTGAEPTFRQVSPPSFGQAG
ncbi:uncharacterized protein LTR77_010665 [Saxophila tyrrhenica]|uniref:Nonsense-mediated mRNA decay factor n=1 Tax=Saxophila tyrrhenica TaxID=1690608 RepID=A0AAV9NXH1_9PEZI|nr:hypothetical protein LTR77_010665 [Saxophila tyrrhenica]